MSKIDLPFFVAIGASGSEGLNDIRDLLGALMRPIDAIVMVVLHRPTDKMSYLQEILSRASSIPVVVAAEAEILVSGTCYIGEPDEHLTLMDTNLAHLVPGPGHTFRNRTVDALFNSLASHAGSRVIGIVLSGSLDDGSRGVAAIHAAHGITMVLDPAHKPRGMQQNAIDYDGPISFVGNARQIAATVMKIISETAP